MPTREAKDQLRHQYNLGRNAKPVAMVNAVIREFRGGDVVDQLEYWRRIADEMRSINQDQYNAAEQVLDKLLQFRYLLSLAAIEKIEQMTGEPWQNPFEPTPQQHQRWELSR